MDQARRQFLAGAGFAADQDRRLTAGQFANHLHHLAHRGGIAQQIAARLRTLFLHRRGHFQGGADQSAQYADFKGLGNEIESPQLERFHGALHIAISGDDRYRQSGIELLNMGDQLQTVAVGQPHVGQTETESVPGQRRLRRLQIGGGDTMDTHRRQGQFDKFADIRLVIDDQGVTCIHVRSSSCWVTLAKLIRKQLPPSGGRIYCNWALLASQISRAI